MAKSPSEKKRKPQAVDNSKILPTLTAAAPSAFLVELPRKRNPEIIEVFVAAHQSDTGFARAFWGADAVPADSLRTLFRAAHAQQITAGAPLAVVESGERWLWPTTFCPEAGDR